MYLDGSLFTFFEKKTSAKIDNDLSTWTSEYICMLFYTKVIIVSKGHIFLLQLSFFQEILFLFSEMQNNINYNWMLNENKHNFIDIKSI